MVSAEAFRVSIQRWRPVLTFLGLRADKAITHHTKSMSHGLLHESTPNGGRFGAQPGSRQEVAVIAP